MTTETKKKIKSLLLIALTVLTIFVFFFTPTKQIFADDGCSLSDDTTEDRAKQRIQEELNKAKEIIKRGEEIKKRLDKITTTVYTSSLGALGAPAAGNERPVATEGNETEFDNLNKELSTHEDTLQTLEDNARCFLSFLKKKKIADAEYENFKTQIEKGFDPASLGPQTCWSWWGGFSFGVCALQVSGWVVNIIIYAVGTILYVAAMIFDLSVWISITQASWYFGNEGMSEGVAMVWKMMRDIANIFFLFILLYIAIGTIFDLSGINDPKKLITNVVIIALLVNFSGFFVRVVVDATNVVAYEFYGVMAGEDDAPGNLGSNLVGYMGLSANLVDNFEEVEIEGEAGVERTLVKTEKEAQGPGLLGVLIQGIMSIVVILVASFVLIVASILFFIRTIVLIIIYIVSPLAFMSKIIPNNKFNYFDTWINSLIKQSLLAPGFLVPLFAVFVILDKGIISKNALETGTDLIVGGVGRVILTNSIVLGLLVGCIFIAQKIGAVGLSLAMGAAGKTNQIMAKTGIQAARLGGRGVARGARLADDLTGKKVSGRVSSLAAGASSMASAARTKVSSIPLGTTGAGAPRTVGSVATSAGGGVKTVWGSDIAKGIRSDIKGTKAAKLVSEAVKNPMLAGNDLIGFAAGQAGVKGVNIFGSSAEARKAAKDTEKKEKEEKEEKEKKDREKKLETASQSDAATILGGMTDAQIKILPAKILTRPEVALNLDHDALTAINKEGKLTKNNKKAIKHIITGTPPEGATGTVGLADAQIWVTTGAGATWPT